METTFENVLHHGASREVNCVQYSVYLPLPDDHGDATEALQTSAALISSFLEPELEAYLWQKDRFSLSIAHHESNDPSYRFLHGITRFGDCIDDEWFVVHLLYTISKRIPEAVISVFDNDGDLLLIEAAMALPAWLDPSNSLNRVYIHQNALHIIPLPTSPADFMQLPVGNAEGKLSRQEAVSVVRSREVATQASEAVQAAIHARIGGYPQAARDNEHRARCVLPSKAAYVLLRDPQLATLAVETFYLRDPIALKACAKMDRFPATSHVHPTLKLTRTAYAQAVSQRFYPPKPFQYFPKGQDAELGIKVACGLEMLYANAHPQAHPATHVDNRRWKEYLSKLTRFNYFRGEREGSQLYNELKAKAFQAFQSSQRSDNIVSEDLDVDDPGPFSGRLLFGEAGPRARIDALLEDYSEEALRQLLEENEKERPDSDAWMNVDPHELEALMTQRMGEQVTSEMERDFVEEDEDGSAAPGVDLESMLAQFEKFVEGSKSGIEGVEIPGQRDPNEDQTESEDDDEDEDDEDEAVLFDTERFLKLLNATLTPESASVQEPYEDILQQMDQEVYGHDKIRGSFATAADVHTEQKAESKNTKRNGAEAAEEEVEEAEEAEETEPVDVQLNLLKNVLESYKSQEGLPGPVGNILGQLGIQLPADKDEQDD